MRVAELRVRILAHQPHRLAPRRRARCRARRRARRRRASRPQRLGQPLGPRVVCRLGGCEHYCIGACAHKLVASGPATHLVRVRVR